MAVSVVLWHSQPIFGYFGLPGDVAVHLFFMISGFYMTLIINGKYNHPNGIKAFYVGRWFRLFPLFYLSVALTLFVHYLLPFMGGSEYSPTWRSHAIPFSQSLALLVPNIAVVGSDIPFLLSHGNTSGWHFSFGLPLPTFPDAERMDSYLLNGPAWTLSHEIWFYLLVPFLTNLRTLILLAITAASFGLRYYLESANPWSSYFFFPANLGFFVTGILAVRASNDSRLIRSRIYASDFYTRMIFFTVVALLTLRQYIPGYRNHAALVYWLFAITLPFLFKASKNWKFDRAIGNLSYPIYILHAPLLLLLNEQTGSLRGLVSLVLCVAVASAVLILVDQPIEKWRQAKIRKMISVG